MISRFLRECSTPVRTVMDVIHSKLFRWSTGTSKREALDVITKFELFVKERSLEIIVFLNLKYQHGDHFMPAPIRDDWARTFQSLSRSIQQESLYNLLADSSTLQRHLFGSENEFRRCSSFIKHDLIPLILDYEMTDFALMDRLIDLYHLRIRKRAMTFKQSVFSYLGWAELVLFLAINLLQISLQYTIHINDFCGVWSSRTHHYIVHLLLPITLAITYVVHLLLAIKTFNRRRRFIFYLQAIAPKSAANDRGKSYQYTSYILEGWNLPRLNSLHNPDFNLSVICSKPSRISYYNILIMSMRYILGIAYCISFLHQKAGMAVLVVLPILIGATANYDSIQQILSSHHYTNVLTLRPPSGHVIEPGEYETDPNFVKCDEMHPAHSSVSAPPWLPFKIVVSWMWWGLLYYLGYCLIFVVVWPTLLLTPFIFGVGIMCDVDPGLEMRWEYRRLARYWAWFMAAKVAIGLTVVVICDIFMYNIPKNQEKKPLYDEHGTPILHGRMEGDDEFIRNPCAFNAISLTAIMMMSVMTCSSLWYGKNSLETRLLRMVTWGWWYLWLHLYAIKQIVPVHQRVVNWRALFGFKWVNTNFLLTQFRFQVRVPATRREAGRPQ